MNRYIDVDVLICNELIPLAKRLDFCHPKQRKGVEMAIQKINAAPTADVVEVVRCKDCIYHIAEYCTRDIKGRTNMFYMTANDFCSHGERKDG